MEIGDTADWEVCGTAPRTSPTVNSTRVCVAMARNGWRSFLEITRDCWRGWAFSLTPSLFRWEREQRRSCPDNSVGNGFSRERQMFALAQRERVGVRENRRKLPAEREETVACRRQNKLRRRAR